jgi:hypothetical protein
LRGVFFRLQHIDVPPVHGTNIRASQLKPDGLPSMISPGRSKSAYYQDRRHAIDYREILANRL